MKRRNHLILTLLLGLGLSAVACVARADDAVTWQLLPDVKVDGTGIFLSQVVAPTTSSLVEHTPQTVVLPHLRLAPAPSLGQTASFTRAQIIELAGGQVPELSGTNWAGPAKTVVSRRTRTLTDSAMLEMVTAVLQREQVKDRGELELRLVRPLPPALIPDEGVTLKVTETPQSGIVPNFFIRCELWNGQEHVSDWQIGLQAKIWRDVPVATERLARGQRLQDAPISLERRDVLVFRDSFINFPTDDPGLELTENVPAGAPVLSRYVRVHPAVQRGRLVDGVYEDGGLSISLKVETLEDGATGQTIRIRNPKTKRELYGKVKNEQTILITL